MKCPACGYYAFNGYECFDCGYRSNRDDLIKFIRSMYHDKTEAQCLQRIEELVKDDVYRNKLTEKPKFSVPADDDTEYLPTIQQPVGAGKISQQPTGEDNHPVVFFCDKATMEKEIETRYAPNKPKFKPGDRVRVTDRIKYWVNARNWDDEMLLCVGDCFTIYKIDGSNKLLGIEKWIHLEDNSYCWPSDCLELVTD